MVQVDGKKLNVFHKKRGDMVLETKITYFTYTGNIRVNFRNATLLTAKFCEENQLRWEFSVLEYLRRLSFFPQFPEITLLWSSTRQYKFLQIQPGCLVKINRTGLQLHEEGRIFLTLDRKLVKSSLPLTMIYPFTVLSGEAP